MKTNPNDAINVCHPQTDFGRGLTKREYFAAMAMQGIVSNHLMIDTTAWDWLSKESAKAADALINALNQPES
jgi:hypothetical protein